MRGYDQPQVDEVYTITQVAERTGVPANTIRSWERRLGFLSPSRTEGNYRRYTESEIGAIVALRDARNRGMSIDQAVREAAQEARPVHKAHAAEVPPSVKPGNLVQIVGQIVDALLAWNDAAATRLASDVSLSLGIDRTCASLYYPASVEISLREATGETSAAAAVFARSWTRTKLEQAFAESAPESGRDSILFATVLDDFWSDALLSHAIAASRSGYRVARFAEVLPAQAIREACHTLRPTVAILASNADHFADFLARLADDTSASGTAIAALTRQPFELEGVTRLHEDALEAVLEIDRLVSSIRTGPRLLVPQ